MAKNTMTGNRALLKVKGEVFAAGTVQDVSISDNYGLQNVDGLGETEVVELVPGLVSHSIQLSRVFIYNHSLFKDKFVPDSTKYLDPDSLDIEIIDKVSGETVEHYTGAKVENYDRSYGKHTLVIERVSLRALHKEK